MRGPGAGRVPFLQLGASLGRTGATFVIASNFAFLFAPLFYFAVPEVDLRSKDPSTIAIVLLTDPYRVCAIGDLLLLIGGVLLATAVALVLPGLFRFMRKLPRDAFLWGGATVVGLIAWVVATLHAQSQTRGGLNAVAAIGGWSSAALALLVASILYVVFALRVDGKAARRGLAPIRWPVFAAMALVGTAFLRPTPQMGEWGIAIGLGLMVVLLPLLGIVAYRDVVDSFDETAEVERRPIATPATPLAPPVAELRPPPPDV